MPSRRHLEVIQPREEVFEYEGLSKSEKKRESTELQALGLRLVELPRDKLRQVEMPEALMDAILHAQTITAHGGRRRQLQYVGKLMRGVDAAPLRAALERFDGTSRAETAAMHLGERWRERLLAADTELTLFLSQYKVAEVQTFRNLVRNARREKESGKPPKDARNLYRAIRAALAESGEASAHAQDSTEPDTDSD